jgi:hypothetical protein
MARVEHASKGFERERRDKESGKHEHGKHDAREDRAGDSRGD